MSSATTLTVLYEDNHIIAVVKPAGVLAQEDKTGSESMLAIVKKYLKEKYKKPGNVFLGLVHRLDRPVQGVMLFAKTSKGASRLSEQFRNHEIKKTYQSIVEGKPKANEGVLKNTLIKDEKLLKGREHKDGEYVELYYKVLKTTGNYSLLEVHIESGKFHQIRTQLSLAGLPILGDRKYGSKISFDGEDIALLASGLEFRAATEDKVISVSMDLPKSWKRYID